MEWFTGCVLYVLIWWVCLFAVLPWGVRPQAAPDAMSGWRGAPEHPRLLRTVIATTIVASVIWLAAIWLINSPYLSFRDGVLAMHIHS
jgi:predicted secreted protein